MHEECVMPILIWIATIACMREIVGVCPQQRQNEEPRPSELNPGLER